MKHFRSWYPSNLEHPFIWGCCTLFFSYKIRDLFKAERSHIMPGNAKGFYLQKSFHFFIRCMEWMHPPQPWCACLIKGCAITYLMHINRITKHARSIQEYSNAITIDLLPSFDIQKCGNHGEKKNYFSQTLSTLFSISFFQNLLRLNSRWSGRIYGGGNTKWRNYECTQFTLEARIRRSINIKLTFKRF